MDRGTRQFIVGVTLFAASLGTARGKGAPENPQADLKSMLDLPYDAGTSLGEEDEGESQVIFYFGEAYEGDSFLWILDLSGSMRGRRLFQLKAQTRSALNDLGTGARFNLIGFNDHNTVFHANSLEAAAQGTKRKACTFVDGLRAIGETHLKTALREGLRQMASAGGKRKTVIVLCDGEPHPEDPQATLDEVTAQNAGRVSIHTILLEGAHREEEGGGNRMTREERIDFMRSLAEKNQGKFRLIMD